MKFTACSQFMPKNYQEKSVEDFIREDHYRKVFSANFTCCHKQETGLWSKPVDIPNEDIWNRLAAVGTVGLGARVTPPEHGGSPDATAELTLLLDVWLVEGQVPQSASDWEEIIMLQSKAAEKNEAERVFMNRSIQQYWPAELK